MASTHITPKPLALVEDEDKGFTVEDASEQSGRRKYPYEELPHDLEIPGPPSLNQDALKRGTNYFRLVELQPGEFKSPLECKISTYNLEFPDFPPYEALSYTWSDSRYDALVIGGRRVAFTDEIQEKYSVRHPLWCEGKRLLIATNLRDALRRFRHSTDPRLLWVDAICINQEDHAERAAQVLLMPKIYHNAGQVLYWLGEEDEGTCDAVKLLKQLTDEGARVMYNPAHLPTRESLLDGSACQRLGLPPFPSSAWEGLARFFERPVFRRVWIIQELAVAPIIVACCGSIVDINLRDIIDAAVFINACNWIYPLDAQYGSGTNMTTFIVKAFSIKKDWALRKSGMKRDLIQKARTFEASDPRDKVFALLGLINDYAHRHTHDLYHGSDFTLDFLHQAGLQAERTSDGGIHIRGNPNSEAAQKREKEEAAVRQKFDDFADVVDKASEILRKQDDVVAELSDCLLRYLAVAIDLLVDIGIRYSDERDETLPSFSDKLNLGPIDLPLLETLLEEVTSLNVALQAKRPEPQIDRLVTYLNGTCNDVRFSAYTGPEPEVHDLIDGVIEANYADEEDLDDAEALCRFLMHIMEVLAQAKSKHEGGSDSEAGEGEDNEAEEFEGNEEEEGEVSEAEENRSEADSEGALSSDSRHERVVGLGNRDQARTLRTHSHHSHAPSNAIRMDKLGQVFASAKEAEARFDEQPKKAWNAWSSDASNLIMPDYLMSVADVYREFTVNCLKEDGFSEVLSAIEDRSLRKIDNLPSWVPDYSVCNIQQQLSSIYYPNEVSSPAAAKWSPSEPNILRVQARFIDTIRVMEGAANTFEDRIEQWLSLASNHSLEGQPPTDDSLWRTIIGNCKMTTTALTYPAPAIYGQYFESLSKTLAFEKELPADREAVAVVINNMLMDPSSRERCFTYKSWHEEKMLFKEAHVRVMFGRLLFLSGSQRYGMAPKSAKQGDRVVLLQGASIPYVVREEDGRAYSLVGECYIHGVMDRDGKDRDGLEWEEISLV